MNSTPSRLVKITKKATSSLSKAQKLFNKLIKKIDAQRMQLRTWQAVMVLYQQKHNNDYLPLAEAYMQRRIQMLLLLDTSYGNKVLTKTDKKKLTKIICEFANDILLESDSDEVKAVFNRHSGEDFDAQDDETDAMAKEMMRDMFGIEIDDDVDINDPEAMRKMLEKQARAYDEKEAARREMMEALASSKKKSAKQIAKENKLAEEEKNVSLSIREVYRKLASTLHPDRETDAVERTRKTVLMQRVNVAYANRDLLRLLELQLEIEQIDETMVNSLSEEKLKHYNQILNEQSRELDDEVRQNCMAFALRYNLDPYDMIEPEFLMPDLEEAIDELQENIADVEGDLESFKQVSEIKAWIKAYRMTPASDDMRFDDFDLVLNEFFKKK